VTFLRVAHWLTRPVNENPRNFVLAIAVVELAALLWMCVWQAELIAYQRDLIRDLQVMLQAR